MQNDILCLTETQLENGRDTSIYESAFQDFFFFLIIFDGNKN